MRSIVLKYDFTAGEGKRWKKYWVWLTKDGFTTSGAPLSFDLADGDEVHIKLVKPKSGYFPTAIDTCNVRFHNVSCPNLDSRKFEAGVGNLETYVVTEDAKGNELSRRRIVPTDTQDRDNLPPIPYWVALPAKEWGTFIIPIIDCQETTKELLEPNKRLAFQWHGKCGGIDPKSKKPSLPTLRVKSLELYIICNGTSTYLSRKRPVIKASMRTKRKRRRTQYS